MLDNQTKAKITNNTFVNTNDTVGSNQNIAIYLGGTTAEITGNQI